jgi:ABC-2 type transport system permease protein
MTMYGGALWAEALKARRSIMPWATLLASALAPLVGGLFMLIAQDPAWALRFGLLSTKAQIAVGAADWATYFGLLTQAVAVGGLILFGMTTIWTFGREWSDRTITDLLALPTPRVAIAGAKFVVVAAWSCVLTVEIVGLGLGIGALVGLAGWSAQLALAAATRIAATAALTLGVVVPFGWVASAGRGYLPPVGALLLSIFVAQIVAALGWGAVFPWSVPALFSGVAGPGQGVAGGSYLLVALTAIVGIAATLAWWDRADQH